MGCEMQVGQPAVGAIRPESCAPASSCPSPLPTRPSVSPASIEQRHVVHDGLVWRADRRDGIAFRDRDHLDERHELMDSLSSIELRVQLVEARRFLIRAGEGRQLCVLVKPAEERERDRRARPADVVVVAVVDRRAAGRVGAAQAVGQNDRGIAGEVGGDELRVGGGRDDDVDLLEERGTPAEWRACARGWPGCIRPPDRSARCESRWASLPGPAR